jgi:hypothetical protein
METRHLRLVVARTVALVAVAGALAGSALAGARLRPDLVETRVTGSATVVRVGGSLVVTDTVRDRGRARAPRSTTGFYVSSDLVRGPDDRLLARRPVRSLAPKAATQASATVKIPGSVAPGSYRILACADDRHRIRESNESNNCRAAPGVVQVRGASGVDNAPPVFAGLKAATTCIPGPVGGKTSASSYRLTWDAATDNVTPASGIVYDVYQASKPGDENFSRPTYVTPAGATSFTTPLLFADATYYFVVRALDEAGNHDSNRVERLGKNLCV